MTILYVDTNIYLDYFQGRTDYMRPLSEFAYILFRRTLSCEFQLVFSYILLEELYYNISKEKTKELFEELKQKNKIIYAEFLREDITKARLLSHEKCLSFNDTLHAIIARRIGASFLVTRNVTDFLELQEIITITLPENL